MRAQVGGVSFWVEPEEQLVSIFLIHGSGGGLRPDFESAAGRDGQAGWMAGWENRVPVLPIQPVPPVLRTVRSRTAW
jgi:hypothetical protein